MSATVVGKCPGCKRKVRLPAEATGKTVRCNHCGMVCEVKPNAKHAAAPPASPPAPPSRPVPVNVPRPAAASPLMAQPPTGSVEIRQAWAHIADDGGQQGHVVAVSPQYRKRRLGWLVAIIAILFLGVCLVGTAVVILKVVQHYKDHENQLVENGNDGGSGDGDANSNANTLPVATKPHESEKPATVT